MKKAEVLRNQKKELEKTIKQLLVDFMEENGEFIIHLEIQQSFVHAQEDVRLRNLNVKLNLSV